MNGRMGLAVDWKLPLPELTLSAHGIDSLDAELEQIAMAFDVDEELAPIQLRHIKVEIADATHANVRPDHANVRPDHANVRPEHADVRPDQPDSDAVRPTRLTSRLTSLTPDERRLRRNEKERQRLAGVKDRVRQLREDLQLLQAQHERLQADLERSALAVPQPTLLHRYLALVKEAEQLHQRKQELEASLRPMALQTAAMSTSTAIESEFKLSHAATDCHNIPPLRMPLLVAHVNPLSVFESLLLAEPLAACEAKALVMDTCREMMEVLARNDWFDRVDHVSGWHGGYVVDKTRLRFKVAQVFPRVSAHELVHRTWTMLTTSDGYKCIQPQTTQFNVLQRVSDECLVVGISVGGALVRSSVVLVARALIHGGYLLTFRSLPLVRKGTGTAMNQPIGESGSIYTYIHSWYNFQERSVGDSVECEVIFGGSARHGDDKYLTQLRVELLAGITRWQAAVGFAQLMVQAAP